MRPNRGSERGAVSLLTAISLVFIVPAVALSVDVGYIVARERKLQSVVDLAAMDAAHALGDRAQPGRAPEEVADEYARASAERNDFDPDATAIGNSLVTELGIEDPVARTFTPLPTGATQAANAVRVTGRTDAGHSFMPGETGLRAEAIAMVRPRVSGSVPTGGGTPDATSTPTPAPSGGTGSTVRAAEATVTVGSTLASFDSEDSFLNHLFGALLGSGSQISLDASGWQGIADADVHLGDLWAELGLGGPDEVATAEVTVARLIDATITTLNARGDPASVAAATALGSLRTGADPSLSFSFGSMIDAGLGEPGSAGDASVSALGLIAMAAQVANGSNAVSLSLPVAVPGVAHGTIKMSLIEEPAIAHGPAEQDADGNWVTRAHTGQLRILIEMDLSQQLTVLGTQVPVRVPVYLETASADASLTGIACAVPTTDAVVAVGARTSAATAYLGTAGSEAMSNRSAPVTVEPAVFAEVPGLIRISGSATVSAAGDEETAEFTGPYELRVQRVGGTPVSTRALEDQLNVTVEGPGLTLTAATIEAQLRAMLEPVLTELETRILEPLSRVPLGISLGTAEVGNPGTVCTERLLVG